MWAFGRHEAFEIDYVLPNPVFFSQRDDTVGEEEALVMWMNDDRPKIQPESLIKERC